MEETVKKEGPAFQKGTEIARGFLENYKKKADPGTMRKALIGVIMFLAGTFVTGLATLGPNAGPKTVMSFVLPGFFVVMTVVMLLELWDHYLWRKKQNAYMLRWLQKKNKEDSKPELRYVLGYVYESGCLGVQDPEKAVQWYEKAGTYAFAQNDLAVCYALGQGVGQDVHRAKKLFMEAQKSGCFFAAGNLKTLEQLES